MFAVAVPRAAIPNFWCPLPSVLPIVQFSMTTPVTPLASVIPPLLAVLDTLLSDTSQPINAKERVPLAMKRTPSTPLPLISQLTKLTLSKPFTDGSTYTHGLIPLLTPSPCELRWTPLNRIESIWNPPPTNKTE